SFDRILSNLVLGYIKKPEAALQELYRVLAPGGRMVISNLKPDGDFSGIYQR
ncbi:MAG: methyltransferase domain-containing protein, partial [Nitrospira sp.]|nr:methyltransferase domain-containing protein [Nitrospira sp.]